MRIEVSADNAPPEHLRAAVRAIARRAALAPALLAPGQPPLSYGDLDRLLGRMGAALRTAGLDRHATVALGLPNGPGMAAALVAIASHAVCAPLNPAYRESELRLLLEDLRPAALVLEANALGPARRVAAERGLRVLDLHWTAGMPAGWFETPGTDGGPEEPPGSRADDIALVLPTSGTTSRPKIVPLSHANLWHAARSTVSTLRLEATDRCLNLMPLFHMHAIGTALLASLHAGGSVVCLAGFEARHVLTWLRQFRPTWYSAAPTLHQAILADLATERPGAARGHLRFVRSAAAPLPPRVARELEEAFGAPVIEAYGMTEAAPQISSNPLPPATRKAGSVGLPAGPEVAIMDDGGEFLPRGAAGEIVIRGASVIREYRADPEANRAAFTRGWLRTGDLGYLDADGYLFITGRVKELINRGGEKIAPREIEEALIEHPAVREAAAFPVPHPTLGEDVAAAVTLAPGASLSAAQARAHLAGRLADFKIPGHVLLVGEIPRGPSGKVQRRALARHLLDRRLAEPVAPGTESERLVAEVFAEVLGRPDVDVRESFFALGGDSLLAGQVLARLRARLGLALDVATLFQAPAAADLARVIDEARAGAPGPPGASSVS